MKTNALMVLALAASALMTCAQEPRVTHTQFQLRTGESGTVRDGGPISPLQQPALVGICGAGSSANTSFCVFILDGIIRSGSWMLQ